MNKEFLENMLLAKQYEKKALESLLPETVRPHMKVIEKELKAMVKETVKGCGEQETAENNEKKVHKVDIQ